jgi:hypothetical protein
VDFEAYDADTGTWSPADKTDADTGSEFIESGKDKNGACTSTGTSSVRPAFGQNFLVLTEPPSHVSGAVLDANSVDPVFDEALIEIGYSNDGGVPAEDNPEFTTVGAVDFTALDIEAGDRLVITGTADDDDKTIVKIINAVVNATTLQVQKNFTSDDMTTLGKTAGVDVDIMFRIEKALSAAEHLEDTYYTVAGNQITIKTTATGIKAVYDSTPYLINYAKIYVGYRELRADLEDVTTLDSTADITAALGKNDERNPLAAGAYVAFGNTSTPVQVFGVASDDSTGHQSAIDKMTSRDDIYCIVPLQDSITAANWVSIIGLWKAHVVAYEAYDKAKFRIVIGSYPDLPTEKASAPASTTGNTLVDPSGSAKVDVVIDPEVATNPTQFVTDEVGSTDDDGHYLEISNNANLETVAGGATIFNSGHAPVELLGAIGEKRLRVDADLNGGTPYPATLDSDYAVRNKILQSEGGPVAANRVISIVDAGTIGGTAGQIGISGSANYFDGVDADTMFAVLTDAASHTNKAYTITSVLGASNEYLQLAGTYSADETSKTVHVYEPAVGAKACDVTQSTRTVEKVGAFADAADGDIAFIIDSPTSGNINMWIVESHTDDQIVLGGTGTLTDDATTATHVVLYRAVSSRGGADLHARKRLTRLRDPNASFLTTVEVGENIEIPYPADTDPTKWDTSTTSWPVDAIVSDEILDADLDTLEELAPDAFIDGYDANDMPYRISIDLDKTAQVTELNTVTSSFANHRIVMVWPNECYVTDLKNTMTDQQNKHHGQYLACAVGGMVSGLPSHQGFTFIGIGGISQIFNSNFYFTDTQISNLSEGGWYVFLQDSETSLPYSAFEVTTDTSAYEFGELMNVKNFDYIALYFKETMQGFLGKYNILPETLDLIQDAFYAGVDFLKLRTFPRIGAPLLSAEITLIEQLASEVDRVEVYAEIEMPKVLNKIGLHLKA